MQVEALQLAALEKELRLRFNMSQTLSPMIFGIHPMRLFKAGIVLAWMVVATPFVMAALPIRTCEPIRKLVWPVVKRGKLLRTDDSSFSKKPGVVNLSVPQSFFTHFYCLGLTWNSILLFLSLGVAQECSNMISTEPNSQNTHLHDVWLLVSLLLLFEIHLGRRLFECIFVSSFHPSARMGIFTYVFGLGYYIAVPLTLFLQSFRVDGSIRAFENVISRNLRGSSATSSKFLPTFQQVVLHLAKLGWGPCFGAAVSVYGMIHQHSCHKILASLREQKLGQGTVKYGIPRGDWFEVSSSAHYLAEIVIYFGLVLASGGANPAMWFMLLAVTTNLYLLAVPTHEWYLTKFENYPTSRRPLFPWSAS